MVSGSAVVTAGKQKLSFTNGQLFTSTNQMYSLADLWQLDGGYDQSFSGKAKGGGSSGQTTFELTTDSNGNLSVLDDTDTQMFDMAWTNSGGQPGLDGWDAGMSNIGENSFTFSNPLTVPDYLAMGTTYTASSALSGSWSVDMGDYGTVDLTIAGNVKMSVLLADHENVTVNGQSVLAAKVQFGLSMSGTLAVTLDGKDYTGTWKVTQQGQLYSTPDAGVLRIAMQLSESGSVKGQGSGSDSVSIDATVDNMPT